MLYPELLGIRSIYRADLLSTSILPGQVRNDTSPSWGRPDPSCNLRCCWNSPRRNRLEADRKILLARRACGDIGDTWIYTPRSGAFARSGLSCKYLCWIRDKFRATGRHFDSLTYSDQWVLKPTISIAILILHSIQCLGSRSSCSHSMLFSLPISRSSCWCLFSRCAHPVCPAD